MEAAQGFIPQIIEIPTFRNITVRVCHDRWAIVVKECAPRVAFVIRHPKLVDAFERFKREGLFNPEISMQFRRTFLEKGGSEEPMVLYRSFTGADPNPDALLRARGLK